MNLDFKQSVLAVIAQPCFAGIVFIALSISLWSGLLFAQDPHFAKGLELQNSGKLEAAIRAVETVDACLGRIYQSLRPRGGAWIITADHGNAETMIDPVTGGPHTYHTTNPVPFIVVDEARRALRPGGALEDIAPTLLGLFGIPRPAQMTGRDLLVA